MTRRPGAAINHLRPARCRIRKHYFRNRRFLRDRQAQLVSVMTVLRLAVFDGCFNAGGEDTAESGSILRDR